MAENSIVGMAVGLGFICEAFSCKALTEAESIPELNKGPTGSTMFHGNYSHNLEESGGGLAMRLAERHFITCEQNGNTRFQWGERKMNNIYLTR